MAAIPRLDVLKAISTETIEKQIFKTHLWYNFKTVKHSEGMPFDFIEMILTIFMSYPIILGYSSQVHFVSRLWLQGSIFKTTVYFSIAKNELRE